MTLILNIFDPNTFPTESGAPPDSTAPKATVNSSSVVDKAIRVKPTEVFPSLLIVDTLIALVIVRLLAQFKTRKETPITNMLATRPVIKSSTMSFPPLESRYEHRLSCQFVSLIAYKYFRCAIQFLICRVKPSFTWK